MVYMAIQDCSKMVHFGAVQDNLEENYWQEKGRRCVRDMVASRLASITDPPADSHDDSISPKHCSFNSCYD